MTYGLTPDPGGERRAYAGVLPSALTIDLPIACVRCGYTLTGLKTSQRCPECNAPVADSVRGDRLQFAPPAYLRSLIIGCRLARAGVITVILAVIVAMIPSLILTAVFWGPPPRWIAALLFVGVLGAPVLGLCAWLIGWWLLTPEMLASPPDSSESRARRTLRAVILAEGVCALLLFGLQLFIRITVIPPSVYIPMITTAGIALPLLILSHFIFADRYLLLFRRRAKIDRGEHRSSTHRMLLVVLVITTALAITTFVAGVMFAFGLFVLVGLPIALALLGVHALMIGSLQAEVSLALAISLERPEQ